MIDTSIIEKKLASFRDHVVSTKTIVEQKKRSLTSCYATITSAAEEGKALMLVRELLETCNVVSRDQLKLEFEKLTTTALQTVFEDQNLTFQIDFVTKRNQIEANFLVGNADNTLLLTDIEDSKGGGVVDVVAFSLRVILMELLKVKGPLILDEPGKFISADYITNFGKFIKTVSKTFNRQVVMITHNDTLAEMADNVISVSQTEGVSKIVQQV